jgi:hypothetical protein
MLLHVPVSLDGLLSLFRPYFSQPSFQTFRAMVVGQVSQTGRRTVCGMLIGARLSGVWEHSRAHRFFSRARWQPDQLGVALAALIVERFLAAEERPKPSGTIHHALREHNARTQLLTENGSEERPHRDRHDRSADRHAGRG